MIDIGHPNAKRVTIAHEGKFNAPWNMVLVLETDLELNQQTGAYDHNAVHTLIEAADKYVSAQNRQIDEFRIVQAPRG
ncbi:MAG: hypothetical protein ACJ8DU_23240 [Microvirga sp.]|nr:hypothetical protein [Beijerinckiaceae bacterium]